jgi:hypothetical protein
MGLAEKLGHAIRSGIHRIGEIEIQSFTRQPHYVLSHAADLEKASSPGYGELHVHTGPGAARDVSTYAEDGTYRFNKAQVNLRRGWVMLLDSDEDLRSALDQFYPASAGVWFAWQQGELEVQNLRDKLERQTGMYRFTRNISDAAAQKLVRETCGPAHACARRILWRLDAATPLEDSEASRYNGIPGDVPEEEAIPLLCREACNHFVSECRQAAKAEAEATERPIPPASS